MEKVSLEILNKYIKRELEKAEEECENITDERYNPSVIFWEAKMDFCNEFLKFLEVLKNGGDLTGLGV